MSPTFQPLCCSDALGILRTHSERALCPAAADGRTSLAAGLQPLHARDWDTGCVKQTDTSNSVWTEPSAYPHCRTPWAERMQVGCPVEIHGTLYVWSKYEVNSSAVYATCYPTFVSSHACCNSLISHRVIEAMHPYGGLCLYQGSRAEIGARGLFSCTISSIKHLHQSSNCPTLISRPWGSGGCRSLTPCIASGYPVDYCLPMWRGTP
jgi:hypothetical protein